MEVDLRAFMCVRAICPGLVIWDPGKARGGWLEARLTNVYNYDDDYKYFLAN